jgi:hypothetical protein
VSLYRAHHGLVAQVEHAMDAAAQRGVAAPLFGAAELHAEVAGLAAAAATEPSGLFARSCDSVALTSFRCGDADGLLVVVCGGNYKDEGCGLAAAAAAQAFLEVFSAPMPASVDVPPALRRAMLAAHDAVLALSGEPIGALELDTVMGRRRSLTGIGVCVTAAAALAARVWTAHVGDGRAYLVREGRARLLTLEHTLATEPAFRAAAARDEDDRAFARLVVLRALGLTEACPAFDVTRVEVQPGDRVAVGNLALDAEVAVAALREHAGASAAEACRSLAGAMRTHFPSAPATVGVIDIAPSVAPGAPRSSA